MGEIHAQTKTRFVYLNDGNLRLHENGDMYRLVDSGNGKGKEILYKKKRITKKSPVAKGGVKEYYVCTYLETLPDGSKKQRTRSVARLVAENFVPNPEGLKTVRFKDGDSTNYHKDNLEWAVREITQDQRERMIASSGYEAGNCPTCGARAYLDERGMCHRCHKALEAIKRREERVRALQEQFRVVDWEKLSERDKAHVKLRTQGYTYEEIGEHLGVTRQAVGGRLNRILKRFTSEG